MAAKTAIPAEDRLLANLYHEQEESVTALGDLTLPPR
jgi:hypothetical protein